MKALLLLVATVIVGAAVVTLVPGRPALADLSPCYILVAGTPGCPACTDPPPGSCGNCYMAWTCQVGEYKFCNKENFETQVTPPSGYTLKNELVQCWQYNLCLPPILCVGQPPCIMSGVYKRPGSDPDNFINLVYDQGCDAEG